MAILSMAVRLSLDTLAEGVESLAQAETLRKLGCGHMQGWAIGQPMPADGFAQWLVARGGTFAPLLFKTGPLFSQIPASRGRLAAGTATGPVTPA